MGMRLGEICALEWDDLSLEDKTITVNKAVQKIKSEVKINTPKTKSSIRTIRLCDECIRLLSELKANQMPKSKYIFPSTVTGEIRDTSASQEDYTEYKTGQVCREYAFTIYGTALRLYPLNKEWTLKPYRTCSVTQTQDLQ